MSSGPNPIRGLLLGTALGDALGLPCEGMKPAAIRRRFGRVDRFRLLGRTGFVSDDTEQAALVALSLLEEPDDPEACAAVFRRHLVRWFLRLPYGVGLATVRACLRSAVGLRPSGVPSAGNGAAMRTPVIGAFFARDAERRRGFTRSLAEVTHRDARAVEGALFAAELAAACCRGEPGESGFAAGRSVVSEPSLAAALDRLPSLLGSPAALPEAARVLGTSGFVLHTVPFAAFCFVRGGTDPLSILSDAVGAGGDTDTIGALLGAWLGALHGEEALPAPLLAQIHDGPFGPTHLRALAESLASARDGRRLPGPRFSAGAALARNLALYPVILAHGFRRLVP